VEHIPVLDNPARISVQWAPFFRSVGHEKISIKWKDSRATVLLIHASEIAIPKISRKMHYGCESESEDAPDVE
jgi:hypothetical protein